MLDQWIPKTEGAGYEMSPTVQTLAPYRDCINVITNLDNTAATVRAGDPNGGHSNISGAFLSGVHAKPTEGSDVQAGVTMDQNAARHFEKHTQLAFPIGPCGLQAQGGRAKEDILILPPTWKLESSGRGADPHEPGLELFPGDHGITRSVWQLDGDVPPARLIRPEWPRRPARCGGRRCDRTAAFGGECSSQ